MCIMGNVEVVTLPRMQENSLWVRKKFVKEMQIKLMFNERFYI